MSDELRLRDRGLDWRLVDGEVIALDVPAALYLGANRSGTVLWEALGRGATHEELVGMLVDQFGVDRDTAARDVIAFVEQLRQRGLVATQDT